MPSFSILRSSAFPQFILSYPPIVSASLHYQSHSQHHNLNQDDAVSLFNRMRPSPPTIQFNEILSSLVKMQLYSTSISLFKRLEFKGITPKLFTLNILINSFSHLGHITFAFSALANILKRGYHPDVITLNTLIKGLCLRGEIKKALHFHDDVVAQGFRLNQVSYGTLINGLCKTGEKKAAIQLLRKREGSSVKPNVPGISCPRCHFYKDGWNNPWPRMESSFYFLYINHSSCANKFQLTSIVKKTGSESREKRKNWVKWCFM